MKTKETETRLATPSELSEALGVEYRRASIPVPAERRVVPPDLLQRILEDQLTEDEVVLELEKLGWRKVRHLFVAK